MTEYLYKRKELLIVGIMCAAAALRFYCLGEFPFFIDEVHAIRFTSGSLLNAMRLLPETPGTAPLDYALVNLFSRISTGEGVIRIPYALAGILTVYLTYRIAARWFGQGAGIIASSLAAVSTAQIFYSQSIRCYSLGMLLILLIADSYDRAFNEGEKRAGTRFVIYATLAFLNQFFSLIPICALLAHALFAERSRGKTSPGQAAFRKQIFIATVAAIAIIAIVDWRLILTPKGLGVMRGEMDPRLLFLQLIKIFAMFTSYRILAPDIIVFALFLFGMFYAARHHRSSFWMMVMIILAPAPAILFQEARLKSGAQLRHYIFALPFYFMAASQGVEWLAVRLSKINYRRRLLKYFNLDNIGRPQWKLAICVLLGWLLIPSLSSYYKDPFGFNGGEADMRPDLRTPAYRLAAETRKDDILISAGVADGPWRYVIDFYLIKIGHPRRWVSFTDIENINDSTIRGHRVLFVYFDFPYYFKRDFTGYTDKYSAKKLNGFITLFEPAEKIETASGLLRQSEIFCLTVAPPSDYMFFSREYTNLGVIARMKGDYPASQKYLERAADVGHSGVLKVVTNEIEARDELGYTYFVSGDPVAASGQWEAAEDLIPRNISKALLVQLDYHPEKLMYHIAMYKNRIGDYEQADAYIRKALEYNPSYAPALRFSRAQKGGGLSH